MASLGIINRLTRASSLATLAFRDGWSSLDKIQPNPSAVYSKRLEQYFLMQAAADGDIFLDNQRWRPYLRQHDLHEKTICIINPVQRLGDFYAGSIYPGYLSSTGFPVVANSPLAIPIVTDDKTLRTAIGQIWQWGNWEENLIDWIKMGAILGDAPVEIVDDVARGKVYPSVIRPEFITDVEFDERKNVTSYTKSYTLRDKDTDLPYVYTRIIDKEKIYTFKDHKPFGYDNLPAVYDNPYGFCPLVWVKHRDPGKGILPGKPAIRDWRKIEELNSDFAALRSYIRKQSLTPMLLAGMGDISPPISDVDGEEFSIEDMLILTAAAEGAVHELKGNLELASAFEGIRMQMIEIDNDHPELKAEENISKMSQVTGPASQDLLGAARRNVKMACMAYDRATKSLHQMIIAIAGMRAKEGLGGWAELNAQQRKFLPYDLDSYVKGDIEFTIAPREVLPQSPYDLAVTRQAEFTAYALGEKANIPLKIQLEREGRSPEEINKIFAAQDEDRARKLKQQKEQLELAKEYNAKLPTTGEFSTTGIPSTNTPVSSTSNASKGDNRSEKQNNIKKTSAEIRK